MLIISALRLSYIEDRSRGRGIKALALESRAEDMGYEVLDLINKSRDNIREDDVQSEGSSGAEEEAAEAAAVITSVVTDSTTAASSVAAEPASAALAAADDEQFLLRTPIPLTREAAPATDYSGTPPNYDGFDAAFNAAAVVDDSAWEGLRGGEGAAAAAAAVEDASSAAAAAAAAAAALRVAALRVAAIAHKKIKTKALRKWCRRTWKRLVDSNRYPRAAQRITDRMRYCREATAAEVAARDRDRREEINERWRAAGRERAAAIGHGETKALSEWFVQGFPLQSWVPSREMASQELQSRGLPISKIH